MDKFIYDLFKEAKISAYVENSRITIEYEPEGIWKDVFVTKYEDISHSVFEKNHYEL
jgi:hypothetical protein